MGSTDVATKVSRHPATSKLIVSFETNAGKIAFTGTDGGAINANYVLVPAGTQYEINVGNVPAIYVASATGSTVCSVVAVGGR